MTIYVQFFKIQLNLRLREYENKKSVFPDCLDYQNSALPNLTKNNAIGYCHQCKESWSCIQRL